MRKRLKYMKKKMKFFFYSTVSCVVGIINFPVLSIYTAFCGANRRRLSVTLEPAEVICFNLTRGTIVGMKETAVGCRYVKRNVSCIVYTRIAAVRDYHNIKLYWESEGGSKISPRARRTEKIYRRKQGVRAKEYFSIFVWAWAATITNGRTIFTARCSASR